MKKLLLVILIFSVSMGKAQQKTAGIEWQKCYGGTSTEYAFSSDKTKDGGVIVTGTSISVNGDITSTHGGGDWWVVKLNNKGKIDWQRSYGGSQGERSHAIRQTLDGGYIIGGYTNSVDGDVSPIYTGLYRYWVVKTDSTGNIQWQKTFKRGGSMSGTVTVEREPEGGIKSIQQTSDTGFILAGWGLDNPNGNTNGCDYGIIKLNKNGGIQWQKTYGGSSDDYAHSVRQTPDGGFIIVGNTISTDGDVTGNTSGLKGWVVKVSDTGRLEWQKIYAAAVRTHASDVLVTHDGKYIIAGEASNNCWVTKIDTNGNTLWQKTYGGSGVDFAYGIVETENRSFVVIAESNSNDGDVTNNHQYFGSNTNDLWAFQIDTAGKLEWQKSLGGTSVDIQPSISKSSDGVYYITSYSNSNDAFVTGNHGGTDYWVLRLKQIDNPDSINGKVFQARNSNCIQESNETGLHHVILQTFPTEFYGISDSAGKYSILTDTGSYTVRQITPAIFKPFLGGGIPCPASGYQTVSFSQYGQDTSEINFANFQKQCAFLQLQLAQFRMRRCDDNTATINYCNIGSVDTGNVQIIVQLPQYVSFTSASKPSTVIGKTVIFDIGTLHADECGMIYLHTFVECANDINGLTQCIKAYILPRNKCVQAIQPDYNLWDKSEIKVEGSCTGATARFVIKNVGQNMTDSSSYRIFKDAVQAIDKRFLLNANDSIVINVTASGFTYRLEADQVIHYPSPSHPSVTIENCGSGIASRNMVSQMEQDRAEQDVEEVCLVVRNSYDPNEKLVFPLGVGEDHRVRHGVPLEFLIGFQNTGNDTAYKIFITDTLSRDLDLSTLEPGASSFPYKIEFTGSGQPILKFTFDNINLVDSTHNEPQSHGFVSFKITPYDTIPNGTIIKNSADIYFDFNLPVKTNTTQVSINDNLPTGAVLDIVTSVKQHNSSYEPILVYPNPFTETANFEFVYNSNATRLSLYDMKGQLLMHENIENKTTYLFHRNSLSKGMYFYTVKDKNGDVIGRGKLVIQ